jgi:D-hexose-6-phosphate mutarotase
VCWPWFSDHPTRKDFPAHGFARNYVWTIRSIRQTISEATQVSLVLEANEATRKFWPQAFELVLKVLINKELSVALTMTNRSEQACLFSSALHSYLQVGNIREIEILGLENTDYLDKLQAFQHFNQQGSIRFHDELDRIYQDTTADIVIRDEVLKRRLKIRKTGSRTTVVWNPWISKSAAMTDFEEGGYKNMVCVEAANATHDSILLQPGQSHCLQTMISVLM